MIANTRVNDYKAKSASHWARANTQEVCTPSLVPPSSNLNVGKILSQEHHQQNNDGRGDDGGDTKVVVVITLNVNLELSKMGVGQSPQIVLSKFQTFGENIENQPPPPSPQ